MNRVIITGANGSGKSHVARQIAAMRPERPLISYDALRLTGNWVKRSPGEIETALSEAVAGDRWILDGGPGVLDLALPRCEGVIWLDPPDALRAWRLALRPWRNFGRSRAELPDGNVDWPVQQYRFAAQSLWKSRRFRVRIETALAAHPPRRLWHCRSSTDVEAALSALSGGV